MNNLYTFSENPIPRFKLALLVDVVKQEPINMYSSGARLDDGRSFESQYLQYLHVVSYWRNGMFSLKSKYINGLTNLFLVPIKLDY